MVNRMWISLIILLGLSVSTNRASVATLSKTDERSILDGSSAIEAQQDFLDEKRRRLHGNKIAPPYHHFSDNSDSLLVVHL